VAPGDALREHAVIQHLPEGRGERQVEVLEEDVVHDHDVEPGQVGLQHGARQGDPFAEVGGHMASPKCCTCVL